ncbi:hypothetical protein RchiOBHm_Chr5g0047901 [Rosa chinensis]|uniref:Uncharacterized protein n=1 Tax=Rosa chinensis TaxID=74649 RepID=A0A2P6QEH3_ROSCH|nr:hypothetical protein RchiOBHm_Chr5g0047901 [Rosa chinensis]
MMGIGGLYDDDDDVLSGCPDPRKQQKPHVLPALSTDRASSLSMVKSQQPLSLSTMLESGSTKIFLPKVIMNKT